MRTRKVLIGFSVLLALVARSTDIKALEPIDTVSVSSSAYVYNRYSDTFDSRVVVLNTGPVTLFPPVRLVVNEASPRSVSLLNQDGETVQRRPYIIASNNAIAPGASVTVIVRLINLSRSVPKVLLAVQANRFDPVSMAMVNMVVRASIGNGAVRVGEGCIVSVDGEAAGLTGSDGRSSIAVPLKGVRLSANCPPYFGGDIAIAGLGLRGGETRQLSLTMRGRSKISESVSVLVDRLHFELLPDNQPFTVLRFFQLGAPLKIVFAGNVEIAESSDGPWIDITKHFRVQAGGAIQADTAAILSLLNKRDGAKFVRASVMDATGAEYHKDVRFYVGAYRVVANIAASPSAPSMPLGGVVLQVDYLDDGLAVQFETETGPGGALYLPRMAAGHLRISGSTSYDGVEYGIEGLVAVDRDVGVTIVPRSRVDIDNLVSAAAVFPL